MPTLRLANLIDGRLQAPRLDRWLDVFEPATGQVFAHCPDSTADDVADAVAAAHRAAAGWAATPVEQRANLLHRLANLVEARMDEFVALESRDSGKPLSQARNLDIPRAVSNLRFFASAIMGWSSESHAMETGAINYTLRQPLGVVGCISPWNLPLYLFTWKIAPALAAGNTVVAKPSEITVLEIVVVDGMSCDPAIGALDRLLLQRRQRIRQDALRGIRAAHVVRDDVSSLLPLRQRIRSVLRFSPWFRCHIALLMPVQQNPRRRPMVPAVHDPTAWLLSETHTGRSYGRRLRSPGRWQGSPAGG